MVFANLPDHQKARLVIGFCRCFQHPSIFPKPLGFVEVDAMLALFATLLAGSYSNGMSYYSIENILFL